MLTTIFCLNTDKEISTVGGKYFASKFKVPDYYELLLAIIFPMKSHFLNNPKCAHGAILLQIDLWSDSLIRLAYVEASLPKCFQMIT